MFKLKTTDESSYIQGLFIGYTIGSEVLTWWGGGVEGRL